MGAGEGEGEGEGECEGEGTTTTSTKKIWGGMGRYGEAWGGVGRYGQVWGGTTTTSTKKTTDARPATSKAKDIGSTQPPIMAMKIVSIAGPK